MSIVARRWQAPKVEQPFALKGYPNCRVKTQLDVVGLDQELTRGSHHDLRPHRLQMIQKNIQQHAVVLAETVRILPFH